MSASPFKDLVRQDVSRTFLNPAEFSEKHTIDDVEMDIIIDNNELIERSAGKVFTAAESGIYNGDILIYVSVKQFGLKPAIGRRILLDGKRRYVVSAVTEEMGIYSIELKSVRS